jgi:hypothetical protein
MNTKKTTAAVEWLGGVASMPNYVLDGDAPYRPEGLFWLDTEGAILGHLVDKPGTVLGQAAESLRAAMERPIMGKPRSPNRVRVASPALAEALREGHPHIDIVCAATPEVDAFLDAMREHIGHGPADEPTYLAPGVAPEAVRAFFRASAGLFRVKPWTVVTSDSEPLALTIPELGIEDAALSVIGQMGESLGLIMLPGLADFEAFVWGADKMQRGGKPKMPPQFVVQFEPGKALHPALRKEVRQQRWELAGANAYPTLTSVDGDMLVRPLTNRELRTAEAIALALTAFVADKDAMVAAFVDGDTVERTLRVATHGGDLEVTLRAPHERRVAHTAPAPGLLRDLFELGQSEVLDGEARGALEEELVLCFAESPEGAEHTSVHACYFVLEYAATYLHETVATLDAKGLHEVVFRIIPRKVSIDASEARWIIEVNRSFYRFLKREFGLAQADDCLRVLGEDAVEELETELSDPSNFGTAKAMIMQAREEGFDISTQEGIEDWMRVQNSRQMGRAAPFGGPRASTSQGSSRAKKDPKKKPQAARKARRTNR